MALWTANPSRFCQLELGAEDTVAPYSVAWNTATVSNGAHVLSAVARDAAGNSSESAGVSVTVSNIDTTEPVISDVTAENITASGATIAWTTNEPADSQVEYGTTVAYGLLSPIGVPPVTSHSVALSGLSPNVTYHYRVRSRDAAGNLAVSGDFTFTTPPVSPVTYTIMPLGDSITRGDTSHNSYRRPLWQKIQAGGYSANFVGDNNGGLPPNPDFDLDNQAAWGIRADQWLPFNDVATRHRPQRVLLYLGVNDLFNGQSAASTYSDIGLLIDTLRNANANVVVLVGKLYLTTDATLNARIQQFNDGLAAWVASKTTQQSPVLMVDHTNVNAATDTWDGRHPNAAGEEKMAANWYSALQPYLR